jgi:hypothetical protein
MASVRSNARFGRCVAGWLCQRQDSGVRVQNRTPEIPRWPSEQNGQAIEEAKTQPKTLTGASAQAIDPLVTKPFVVSCVITRRSEPSQPHERSILLCGCSFAALAWPLHKGVDAPTVCDSEIAHRRNLRMQNRASNTTDNGRRNVKANKTIQVLFKRLLRDLKTIKLKENILCAISESHTGALLTSAMEIIDI